MAHESKCRSSSKVRDKPSHPSGADKIRVHSSPDSLSSFMKCYRSVANNEIKALKVSLFLSSPVGARKLMNHIIQGKVL
jgi:hypothetical protein